LRLVRRQREDLERQLAARRPLEERRIARAHRVVHDRLEDGGRALALHDLALHQLAPHPERQPREARLGRHREHVAALQHARGVVGELLLDLGAGEAVAHDDVHAVGDEPHAGDDLARAGHARAHRAEAARARARGLARGLLLVARLDRGIGRSDAALDRAVGAEARAVAGSQLDRRRAVARDEPAAAHRDLGAATLVRAHGGRERLGGGEGQRAAAGLDGEARGGRGGRFQREGAAI
jgi:hypothetical protein